MSEEMKKEEQVPAASKTKETAKKAATTVKKAASTVKKVATDATRKTAEAIVKASDASKKKAAEKKAEAAEKKAAEAHGAEGETKKKSKIGSKVKSLKLLGGVMLSKMARGGAKLLRRNADEVNKLNVFPVPDGDTGDNMRMTIESGIAAIENLDSDDLAEVMKVLSHGMLLGARGNSGVILSQFFAGTAKGLEGVEQADPAAFGHALERGVAQAYASVMTPTEGTILTVAREAVEYAVARITPESTIRTLFADLVKEMHDSLDRTPEILAVLKEADVVDSGGAGLLYIMDGFNRVLNGEEISQEDDAEASEKTAAKPAVTPDNFDAFGPDSVMTYGYCTELLVRLQNSKTDIESFDVEALKAFLSELGDSIVAFRTESVVKIHVHTLTPERVLAHCRTFGEFLAVKIENMSLQHSSIEGTEEPAPAPAPAPVAEAPKKPYGVVAVCIGAGIEKVYREMGCDEIVEGGQTQNPSTNDFLAAFEKVNAEHIFTFPNNGNILMAAQQAAELYTKAKIHVIPSKSVGTGYVALSTADFSMEDADAIAEGMTAAMKQVTSGYVSPSIRDAQIGGVEIHKDDTIGVIEKEIVVSCAERLDATVALVEKMMADGKFMLTVFCGKDSDSAEQETLQARLGEVIPDAEVYFIDGGQDIYPYIFVAE
ncbi:MAG: DAK2 domain-containing protein [Clostridia bacterium]|nr:DAK2 domain-containing protein [Clostridia bacterium]